MLTVPALKRYEKSTTSVQINPTLQSTSTNVLQHFLKHVKSDILGLVKQVLVLSTVCLSIRRVGCYMCYFRWCFQQVLPLFCL